MASSIDILLSAHTLIRAHEDGAEEYATKMLWKYMQEKDDATADKWRLIILGIKEVRVIIAEVDKKS